MDISTLAYIIRSRTRTGIILTSESPIKPSTLARKLQVRHTHLSRELKGLKEKRLISCLNPKEKNGRIYQLTPKGKELLSLLKNIEL